MRGTPSRGGCSSPPAVGPRSPAPPVGTNPPPAMNHSAVLRFQAPNPESQAPRNPKNAKSPPQVLFRLEPTPTVCFLQLTRNLNEPMFRLEKEPAEIPHTKNNRHRRPTRSQNASTTGKHLTHKSANQPIRNIARA